MCGIFAIAPAPGSTLHLGRMTRAGLKALLPRGHHATGAAWQRADQSVWYAKAGQPADVWAPTLRLSRDAGNVLGHVRYATTGSPRDNRNNHPVVRPGIVLIHNGTVANPELLYAMAGATALAEVDTDAVAAALADAKPSEIVPRLAAIEGSAALAWLHPEDPTLHVARLSGRPLLEAHWPDGSRVYASTLECLARMSVAARVSPDVVINVPVGTYLAVRDGKEVVRRRVPVDEPRLFSVGA